MTRWKFLCATFALALGSSVTQAAIPVSERQVLVDLYASTTGANWINRAGWLGIAGSECSWFGITCDGPQQHVIEIDLPRNRLSGSLPSLTALPALASLTLSVNQLTGAIPTLNGLTSLRFLNVESNRFTGSMPSLTGLTALNVVIAGGNQLTGSIPLLAGLTSLVSLNVVNNQLTGPIPPLEGLPNLRFLLLQGNQLTGTPPAEPGGLLLGLSQLCPNFLSTPSPTDAAWNAATSINAFAWSRGCTAPPYYNIIPVAGANGAINPPQPQSSLVGTTLAFTVVPNAGYAVDTVGGCNGALRGDTFTTAPAIADCRVTATFKALAPARYIITPSAGPGGSVAPATPQSLEAGAVQAFTIAPSAGFDIDTVSGCGGALVGSTFTTAAATADCTVSVTFKATAGAPRVTPVPTLSDIGLVLLALVLAGAAALRIRGLKCHR